MPNIRQVLLIDTTILSNLADQDIHLEPGMLGENLILDGINLMALPIGTRLEVGEATLELTELRHPCYQLNESHLNLLEAVKTSGARPGPLNAACWRASSKVVGCAREIRCLYCLTHLRHS